MCPLSLTVPLQNITILLLAIICSHSKYTLVDALIRCYKCGATEERTFVAQSNSTITIPKCSNLEEYSENFIKDCQYSTMCLKTITVLRLQHKKQITITRGCATQKDIQQVFNNEKWHEKYSIQEVFEEGCTEEAGNLITTPSSKTHCYCRGDLCNSAQRISSPVLISGVYLSLLFLVQLLQNVTNIL